MKSKGGGEKEKTEVRPRYILSPRFKSLILISYCKLSSFSWLSGCGLGFRTFWAVNDTVCVLPNNISLASNAKFT